MKKIIISTILASSICYSAPSVETGRALQEKEQFADATACYKAIIAEEPNNIGVEFNLGCSYLALGEYEEAIAAFTNVINRNSNALPAVYNLAYTYKTMGDLDTAIQLYKNIIAMHPDYEPAQLGLGFAYITQGNFAQGWKQHQRYLKQSGKNGDALRTLLENDTVAYKKILLRPEGGLGDTLNFIRYAELLKNMGADVIVSCQKQLIPLLSRCTYIDLLIPCGIAAPEYDADATLMSMPAICGDTQDTVPQTIPYIFAAPELISYWQKQLFTDTNFKVGLCWQADVHNDTSKLPIARRGIPLEHFSALADINGVSFYSLQRYDGTEQLSTLSPDFKLIVFEDLDEKAGPFMDTAAIIKNLDLIITVDTAVAHLAGALGKPVWLLHPYATADWRWIHGRTDSYWYPTLRIFKQQKPFDYQGVMNSVHDALHQLIVQQ